MNIKQLLQHILLILLLLGISLPTWAAESATSRDKVVFHVDDIRNARWAMLLANSYLADKPSAKIVFVTYGPGIDFLLEQAKDRRDKPFEPAVKSLIDKGVVFRVCAETLDARSILKEEVLDSAEIIPSGITEIVHLQTQEGYAYLKP